MLNYFLSGLNIYSDTNAAWLTAATIASWQHVGLQQVATSPAKRSQWGDKHSSTCSVGTWGAKKSHCQDEDKVQASKAQRPFVDRRCLTKGFPVWIYSLDGFWVSVFTAWTLKRTSGSLWMILPQRAFTTKLYIQQSGTTKSVRRRWKHELRGAGETERVSQLTRERTMSTYCSVPSHCLCHPSSTSLIHSPLCSEGAT